MTSSRQRSQDILLLVGSYTVSMPHVDAKGDGITVLRLDRETGMLAPVSRFSGLRNPTYLAFSRSGSKLYAVEELLEEEGASAATLSFDSATGRLALLASVPALGDAPCHIALDRNDTRLFVSNYGGGNLVSYALDADGLPSGLPANIRHQGRGPNPERQEGPHIHQATVTPDGKSLLVCDAGTDRVVTYEIASGLIGSSPDGTVQSEPGAMPRHLVITPDGRLVFVVHELGCTISSYAYEGQGLRFLSKASTLPDDYAGSSACAAIRLHPNGRFLYASNRGHDSIAVWEISSQTGYLRPAGFYRTGGKTPRDFAIDPTGKYLVAANQDSHSLCVFEVDPTSGALQEKGEAFSIGSPACIVFAAPSQE